MKWSRLVSGFCYCSESWLFLTALRLLLFQQRGVAVCTHACACLCKNGAIREKEGPEIIIIKKEKDEWKSEQLPKNRQTIQKLQEVRNEGWTSCEHKRIWYELNLLTAAKTYSNSWLHSSYSTTHSLWCQWFSIPSAFSVCSFKCVPVFNTTGRKIMITFTKGVPATAEITSCCLLYMLLHLTGSV